MAFGKVIANDIESLMKIRNDPQSIMLPNDPNDIIEKLIWFCIKKREGDYLLSNKLLRYELELEGINLQS